MVDRMQLDAGGVEHDANTSSKGLGWDVVCEFGAYDARVAVWTRDAAPDNADLAATNLLVSLVYVCHTLAQVELGILGSLDTLNLDQRSVACCHLL